MSNARRPQDNWKAAAANNSPRQPGANTPGQGRRWFLAAFILVALVGAIGGLLFYVWPKPSPLVIAIAVTSYDDRDWPPNAWADHDGQAFLERFAIDADKNQEFQAQEKHRIIEELDSAARKSTRQPIVVYLSALGVAADGTVYLIPARGQPADPKTWLSLDDLLSPLRQASGRCLLILDVRPGDDPRSVIVGEDVNELLDATLIALTDRGDLPFFVLTANTPPTGVNQFRPLGRSAFGLALVQGAGGAADSWNPEGKKDGHVSVTELAAYTRELTHHASVAAGLPPQLPRLHGNGTDFSLMPVPPGGASALPTMTAPEPYPPWLQAAWEERDRWVKEGLHLRAPRLVHHYTLTASRAERRWLAGVATKVIEEGFDSPASRLKKTRESIAPLTTPNFSIARVKQKPTPNATSVPTVVQDVFDLILRAPQDRGKKLDEAMIAVREKSKGSDVEQFDVVADAAFTFALKLEKPTHDRMKELARLVGACKPRSPTTIRAELLVLSLIGELDPDVVDKRWPARAIGTLLRVAQAAEAAVACDGRCLPWIEGELKKADEKRRKATRDLCEEDPTKKSCEAAVTSLEEALEAYDRIEKAATALMAVRKEYEETRAVLVDLAVVYPHGVIQHPEEFEKTWRDLVDDVLHVQARLRMVGPELPDPVKLGEEEQKLRSHRREFYSALAVRESGSIRQYENLLRWPNTRKEGTARDQKGLLAGLDKAELDVTTKLLDVKSWPRDRTNREHFLKAEGIAGNALRDLRRGVAILEMVKHPEAKDLSAQIDRLGTKPPNQSIVELARKVRSATRGGLKTIYREADPHGQAEIGWAVDPDDVPAFEQSERPGPPNPELLERQNSEKLFYEWLAKNRYAADVETYGARGLLRSSEVPDGYHAIARICREFTP